MVTMARRKWFGNRVGFVYLVLAVAGALCALGLAAYYHLGTAAETATMLPSVAGLYLSWVTFQAGLSDGVSGRDLATVAGDLANAVEAQWRQEARLRRLNDPYPLPVSWSPAAESLVEAWPLLTATARQWPGGPPNQPAEWANEPSQLAAQWAQIVEVFRGHVPTRRLVVLGEPGSGKTMLLVRLTQGLLAERAAGAELPVPVIFSLASWNPQRQDLFAWMSSCMERDYLGLEQRAPAPYQQATRARALLDQRLVLPVLDGFDEMAAGVRAAALDAINQALPAGQGLVLSSRTEEYRRAVLAPGSVSVKLTGAAGIELRPLEAPQVGAYLLRDAGDDDDAARRWSPVIEQLGTAAPVGLALRRPLMLFLARTLYNPRPGEHSGENGGAALPDPRVLCDKLRFPDQQAVEQHLLSSFIPACYRPPLASSRLTWDAERAQRTFSYLARHLEDVETSDLAWWRLADSLPRRASTPALWIVLMVSLAAPVLAMAVGIAGLAFGIVRAAAGDPWGMALAAVTRAVIGGAVLGATFGLTTGATAGRSFRLRRLLAPLRKKDSNPITSVGWSFDGRAALFAALLGAAVGTVIAIVADRTFGLTIAVFIAVTGLLWGGARTDPADVTRMVGPDALLSHDRRITLQACVFFSLVDSAITGVLVAMISHENIYTYTNAIGSPFILGAVGGLALGIVAQPDKSAWWAFTVVRWHLSWERDLPRDLMGFLVDAHRRGVLRQVGGIYQFRHLDLQRHLADQPSAPTSRGGTRRRRPRLEVRVATFLRQPAGGTDALPTPAGS